MRDYNRKEIQLLEQCAVQLRECNDLLDAAGVPFTVITGENGKSENGTHSRLKWFLEQKTLPKPKPFWPKLRVSCYWEKNHLGCFLGSNESLSGDAIMFWIGKLTFVLYKKV